MSASFQESHCRQFKRESQGRSFCLQGQVSDIAIHAQEILRMRTSLNEIYASHTGQPVDVIGTTILTPCSQLSSSLFACVTLILLRDNLPFLC